MSNLTKTLSRSLSSALLALCATAPATAQDFDVGVQQDPRAGERSDPATDRDRAAAPANNPGIGEIEYPRGFLHEATELWASLRPACQADLRHPAKIGHNPADIAGSEAVIDEDM